MTEYEALLDDLLTQQAKLELERGYKLTKKDMLDFIGELLKGNPQDKEYQRSIIDNLVYKVIVSDDDTIVLMNIKGDKTIEGGNKTTFSQIKETANNVKIAENHSKALKMDEIGVQTQLPPPRQSRSCS